MILLQILKVLGWILLLFVLLVAVLLLIFLFYPITYRISGSYHSALRIHGRANWLFHLVSAHYVIEEGHQTSYLKILWFRVPFPGTQGTDQDDGEQTTAGEKQKGKDRNKDRKRDKNEKKNRKKDRNSDRNGNGQTAYREEDFFDDEEDRIVRSGSAVKDQQADRDDTDRESFDYRSADHKSMNQKFAEHKSTDHESDGIFHRIRQALGNLMEKFKEIKRFLLGIPKIVGVIRGKGSAILQFIQDTRNQNALRHLKNELFLILKWLRPGKLHLKAEFGTGSPDTTGIALGILAMFPMGYQNRWNISPDFECETPYLELDFDARGHVFVFQILGSAIRMIRDKDIRRIMNHMGK